MTSPIDPPRRSNGVRRVRRSDDAARPDSTDRSLPVVYEPAPPPAPAPSAQPMTAATVPAATADVAPDTSTPPVIDDSLPVPDADSAQAAPQETHP